MKNTYFAAILLAAASLPANADWVAGRDMAVNEGAPNTATESQNPNATAPAWSYGFRTTLAFAPTPIPPLTLFTPAQHVNSAFGYAGGDGFISILSPATPQSVIVNTSLTPIVRANLLNLNPGEIEMHPGQAGQHAIVRWTAPNTGSFSVTAGWRDNDPNGSPPVVDGATGSIVVNGTVVFTQTWTNGGAAVSHTIPILNLTAGDVVDFAVGMGASYFADSTRFDATITLANPAPTDITLSSGSIAENNAANATVGTLTATDNVGDTNTFSLVTGTGSTDNASFTIAGSVLKLTPSSDFETKNSYSVRVRATDTGGGFFEKAFTISITNVNEMPTFTKGADQTIPVTTSAQSATGWATAINDGDSTVVQGLTFNITGNTNPSLFTTGPAINSAGTLTYTPAGVAGTATITVTLTDDTIINGAAALTTASQTFTITLTNPAPTNIILSAYSIAENNAANATVGTITATDNVGDTNTFSLVTGSGSTDNANFTIAGTALKLTPSANFETKNSYDVLLRATDSASGFVEKALTITITNVNELPSFTKGADQTVSTTASAQSVAGWATAINDGDSTVVQGLTINITGNTNPSLFATSPTINSVGTLIYTPAGSAGSATITVTLTDDASINGTAALTTAAQTFVITASIPVPSLASLSPATGSTTGGNNVTLTGSNFTGVSSVTFDGIPATGLIIVNDTTLACIAPPHAMGPVSVIITSPLASNAANTAYTYVNAVPGFVLPEDQPAGLTWTARATDALRNWYDITGSADGVKLAAVAKNDGIYTSIDSGVTWAQQLSDTTKKWYAIASSADGVKLTAVVAQGYIYTSTNSGQNWTARMTDANRNWSGVTSSADGVRLAATTYGTEIYTSVDSGVTWTAQGSGANWNAITSSADGTKLVAGTTSTTTGAFTSNDSGFSWAPSSFIPASTGGYHWWNALASSADGINVAGVNFSGKIYTSVNSGGNWTARASQLGWHSIASSADGMNLAATEEFGRIYISNDYGVSWTPRAPTGNWFGITSSADGGKLAACQSIENSPSTGYIYTSDRTILSVTRAANSGLNTVSQFASVINPGSFAESTQTVSFLATNDNNSLFIGQPAIDSSGNLTFTPGLLPGTANVTVRAQDNGGTANGGIDTSGPQTFTIIITPEPIPTITAIDPPYGTIDGDTAVIITGTYFTGATVVTIGGLPVTNLEVVDDNTITCNTAAHAAGAVNVSVTTPIATATANSLYSYVFINQSPSFHLPTEQAAGTVWTPRSAVGVLTGLASSADGSKLASGAAVYGNVSISSDFGQTWLASNARGSSVALSADGTKLIAAQALFNFAYNTAPIPGVLSTSTDSGNTWTQRSSSYFDFWTDVASSGDGRKLVATNDGGIAYTYVGGKIYTSSDYGATWKPRDSNRAWTSVASSADGSKLAAVVAGGRIYTSINSGLTWTARESNRSWTRIASSSDGNKLVAVAIGEPVFLSTDSGVTWSTADSSRHWMDVCSSSDGIRLTAVESSAYNAGTGGNIYTSTNSGATWTQGAPTFGWTRVTCSADGYKLAAAGFVNTPGTFWYSGQIYTSTRTIVSPSVPANSGPATFANFATNISRGPINEASQTVVINVTSNTNSALFITQPAIAANGDLTFTPGSVPGSADITVVAVDNGGTAYGGTDTSYSQTFTITITPAAGNVCPMDPLFSGPIGQHVSAIAVQPDGSTVVAGYYDHVGLEPRSNIARLKPDGTLDLPFDPNPNSSGSIDCAIVLPDGKILIGGSFTTLQPNKTGPVFTRHRIARLNQDGSVDTSFNQRASNSVRCMALQKNGKILIGGDFTIVGNTPINYIARLNSDGTLDTGFHPNPDGQVYSIAVQDNGNVIFGGQFTSLQPNGISLVTRNNIARVTAAGAVDNFNPNIIPANNYIGVKCIVIQPDGKVLIGGYFSALDPNNTGQFPQRQAIARVNSDGTLDTAFDPAVSAIISWTVYSMTMQANRGILLGGRFDAINNINTWRNNIARISANGVADGFDPSTDAPLRSVFAVAQKSNGMVLLGGDFTSFQPNGASSPTARNIFACLFNDAATQTLTVPSSTQALWTRSGACPELIWATFEVGATANGPWGAPVFATRVANTSNWQTSSLTLPASGFIRARGRTIGGLGSASSGLIEQIASIPTPTNLAPTSIALTYANMAACLPENNPVNANVGTLTTADADPGDTHTYALEPGGADNSFFTLTGNSLFITPSADFETKSSYTISVRSTDQGGSFVIQTIIVSICDVNERPFFVKGPDLCIPGNVPLTQTYPSWATNIDDGDSSPGVNQTMLFAVMVTSGNSLFTVEPYVLATTGNMYFTLAPGASGTATVVVSLSDDNSYGSGTSLSYPATYGTMTFTITVDPSAQSFATWATSYGLTGNNALPNSILGGDGITNLMKFACNMDPTQSNYYTLTAGTGTSGLPLVTVTTSNGVTTLCIEYVRRKCGGITYWPQITQDLSTGLWLPITGTPTVTNIDSVWERVKICTTAPPGTATTFARLKVTSP